jgi:hypothetical protein
MRYRMTCDLNTLVFSLASLIFILTVKELKTLILTNTLITKNFTIDRLD